MKGSKINVWRVKNIVSVQIIELNNYEYGEKGHLFTSSDGFQIRSENYDHKHHGGISRDFLWLPTKEDIRIHKVNSLIFFDGDDGGGEGGAKKLLDRINKALFEWKKVQFKSTDGLNGLKSRLLIDKIWSDHFEGRYPMEFREEFGHLMEDAKHDYIQDGGDVNNHYDYKQYMLSVSSDIVSNMDLEYDEYRYDNGGWDAYR